jgi:hypothetical protein
MSNNTVFIEQEQLKTGVKKPTDKQVMKTMCTAESS